MSDMSSIELIMRQIVNGQLSIPLPKVDIQTLPKDRWQCFATVCYSRYIYINHYFEIIIIIPSCYNFILYFSLFLKPLLQKKRLKSPPRIIIITIIIINNLYKIHLLNWQNNHHHHYHKIIRQ
jgi:hypothetical protein